MITASAMEDFKYKPPPRDWVIGKEQNIIINWADIR